MRVGTRTKQTLPPWPDAPAVLTSREAARYVRVSWQTWRALEMQGRVPPCADVGAGEDRAVRRYARTTLDAWIAGTLAVEAIPA